MDGRSSALRERFLRLRAAAEGTASVFGSSAHAWRLGAPLDPSELAALEKRLGTALPDEARAFFGGVTRGPMGPHHGFVPLKRSAERPGDLVLADEGCGARSVLVLTGPKRGRVVSVRGARRTEAAAGFLAWVEAWLDGAWLEWAEGRLFDAVRGGAPAEVLAEVRGALGRTAPATERWHAVSLVVAAADRDVERALDHAAEASARFFDVNADRRDPRHLAHEESERRARLALHRARVFLLAGDPATAAREATLALHEPGAWVSTRDAARALHPG